MAKLSKSSRPDRRGPSKTFKHPYQLDMFVPLASGLREVGAVAKFLITIYFGLTSAYIANSQWLSDGSELKSYVIRQSVVLALIFALIFAVEVLRTLKAFDYERLGKFPKHALICLHLAAGAYAIYTLVTLPMLNSLAYELRIKDKERREAEKERKDKAAEAECLAQKTKDVDALTKRRAAAYSEHKKCLTEYVKPMFSSETAEQFCAPKYAIYQQLAQSVKERQAKECPPASK